MPSISAAITAARIGPTPGRDWSRAVAALGHDIFTEGDTLEELRANVREAVQCHFGDGVPGPLPQVIRLHFVRDEILAT